MHLETKRVTVMMPVEDETRAHRFYEDVLGLSDEGTQSDGTRRFSAGDVFLALRADPAHIDKEHTALGFEVEDLDGAMNALKERGVKFEEYDTPALKTEGGVASLGDERAAWFCDSEGNILCLHARV